MKTLCRVVLFAGAGIVLAGCNTERSFLHSTSLIASHQAALYQEILFEAAFIFLFIAGALVWILVRGARRNREKGLPPQVHGRASWAIAAAVLILVADGVDFGLMVNTMRHISPPEPAQTDLNVNIVGHRWWWEFDYPDLGIKTANELHIPVGTNVKVTLRSVDVIHSFWAPQIAGKTDAIPGQPNHMWLLANHAGVFPGQCSEFCGTQHALMRLLVIADTPADFDAWVQAQRQPAAAPHTAQEQAGYEILTTTCGTCHSLDPADERDNLTGPNLAHLLSRSTFAGAAFDMDEANLRQWVHDTQAMKPENDMNIKLRPDDLDSVISYLMLLK